jgi:ferritin-like metal-binding protein YciE
MDTQTQASQAATHSKLEEFFTTSLQELYWCEQNLVNVLNTMSEVATAAQLRSAFTSHRDQTWTHVRRLEEVFSIMGVPMQAEPSIGLQGLFDEGWQVIDESEEGSAQRDVALIIAAQKVEHYEMACYGSMVTLARTLGRSDVAELLIETLTEEKETDALLTEIAESWANPQASKEPATMEDTGADASNGLGSTKAKTTATKKKAVSKKSSKG